jgi:hypothetical protein
LNNKASYASGGAGYVISRAALARVVFFCLRLTSGLFYSQGEHPNVLDVTNIFREQAEDVYMGRALNAVNVTIEDGIGEDGLN